MKVIFGLNNLPVFRHPAITIGSFDGIHNGHRKILNQVGSEARKINGESLILTFEPHPRYVIGDISQAPKLLHTLEEKISAFQQYDLDYLVVIPFSVDFANQEAEQYIEDFLIENFHPEIIVIGYDHHFGRNRSGNIQLLRDKQKNYHYHLIEISAEEVDEMAISSSRIRKALLRGDIEEANQLLCSPYSLKGKVMKGDQRGRTIGFPTANLQISDQNKLIPALGVYGVELTYNGHLLQGMLNIGYRPTVSQDHTLSLEVHILHFNENIYDQILEVRFLSRIRNEIKFDSLDELKAQLERDKEMVLRLRG